MLQSTYIYNILPYNSKNFQTITLSQFFKQIHQYLLIIFQTIILNYYYDVRERMK